MSAPSGGERVVVRPEGEEEDEEEGSCEEAHGRLGRKGPGMSKQAHLPFWALVQICVMGHGFHEGHRQPSWATGEWMPGVSIYYGFPASEGGVGGSGMVGWEGRARMTCATVVGTTGQFVGRRSLLVVREFGVVPTCFITNSDGEAAIRGVACTVSEDKSWEAPRGSGGSNGFVEAAIHSVAHQTKVIKYWLEDKCGRTLPGEHPLLPWMVENVAELLNTCEVSRDGFAAYRRLKGEGGTVKGRCVGEQWCIAGNLFLTACARRLRLGRMGVWGGGGV